MRCRFRPLFFTLCLLGCGALLTQTKFFQFDLVHDGQPLSPGAVIVLDSGTIVELSVDLSEVDLYSEHSEEIEQVDRVGLEADIRPAAACGFSLYLSSQSGLSDPATEAIPLIRNYSVSSTARRLEFDDTEKALENRDELASAVRAGSFQLYLVGEGPASLSLDTLELVVAITVGL